MAIELTAKLLWAAVGFAIIRLAAGLGVGNVDEPGPGMLSLGLGAIIVLIGLGGAAKLLIMRKAELSSQPWSRAMIVRVAGVVVLLAAYIAVFEKIGFLISTFALMAALLLAFAQLRWMWAVTLAAVLSISNYALFKLLLGTQLPAGILG
jgi:putative tricarboxylic transport membrane protein